MKWHCVPLFFWQCKLALFCPRWKPLYISKNLHMKSPPPKKKNVTSEKITNYWSRSLLKYRVFANWADMGTCSRGIIKSPPCSLWVGRAFLAAGQSLCLTGDEVEAPLAPPKFNPQQGKDGPGKLEGASCGSSFLTQPLWGERQEASFLSTTWSILPVIKLKRDVWSRSFQNYRESSPQWPQLTFTVFQAWFERFYIH